MLVNILGHWINPDLITHLTYESRHMGRGGSGALVHFVGAGTLFVSEASIYDVVHEIEEHTQKQGESNEPPHG